MPVASAGDLPVSSDTWQDQVLERRRDELGLSLFVLDDDKEVHRSDLGQVVLLSVQPQVLSVSLLGSLELGHHTRRVATRWTFRVNLMFFPLR